MFSKLAEIDFPGITFTKKFKVRNWLDLAGSHEILTHARGTTQKSVSLIANPRDLATMTMYNESSNSAIYPRKTGLTFK